MASKSFSKDLISNRYASAIYDLSSESNSVEEILNDFVSIKEYNENNKDFKLLIRSPLISSNVKLKIVKKILSKISNNDLTLKFINLLAYNKRMNFLPSVIDKFIEINSHKRGDVIAEIISAEKLSLDQKNSITNHLNSILGDKLSLNFSIDTNIIGGLILKIGSRMIDSSLGLKINKLQISMKEA